MLSKNSLAEDELDPGESYPLGARLFHNGVNFSVYSRGATGVELLLFDHHDDRDPARIISLAV